MVLIKLVSFQCGRVGQEEVLEECLKKSTAYRYQIKTSIVLPFPKRLVEPVWVISELTKIT